MVAMTVWPTDAADGSVANEARWRKMGRLWVESGIAPGIGGELAPSLSMPNLTVQSGAAWVDGHYAELSGNQVLTATANGLAVVRFDPAANTAELLWRDGISVPAQSPTGTWELPIARTVGSVLTDLRRRVDVVPTVSLTRTNVLSLPHNTTTAFSWDVERFDTDNMHSSPLDRITFNTAGIYTICFNAEVTAGGSGGARVPRLRLNGSGLIASTEIATNAQSGLATSAIWKANAGDYVTAEIYQTTGVALSCTVGNAYSPNFWAVRHSS